MSDVPKTHPRYLSLALRDTIVAGVEQGITSIHGLIAHGRGEAFDYLIGEATQPFATEAIHAAAAMLRLAEHPVISVNGNVAALAPEALIELGQVLNAPLEVNIFHTETGREQRIREHLLKHKARLETSPASGGMDARLETSPADMGAEGAPDVLMPTTEAQLSYIDSNRKFVHPDGIFKADVVFVPLEDGDRCEALRKMGKAVVTVDLNPMSRTAKQASITIVDNVVRALPLLCEEIQSCSTPTAQDTLKTYSNEAVLQEALRHISRSGNG
ncbi:phosphopantothenate/pantothenate synthetase [Candidatus Poribacteria bacterium]|nr:MAG: phosphopantothenate/pantothenate synthetase [Candidatus Poribacteria bacterium]